MEFVLLQMQSEWEKVVKKLLDAWEEERAMKRKVRPDPVSLRQKQLTHHQLSQISSSVGQKTAYSEVDLLDPRDIDKLLIEMAAMARRFAAFRRFLYHNFKVCLQKVVCLLNFS